MVFDRRHIDLLQSAGAVPLKKNGFRHSAVLVPIVRESGADCFVLTRRSEHLPHHKGQISFPGGAMEEGESAEETALRESMEEIALASDRVRIVCRLNDIWTPSQYIITPVVGLIESAERLTANPSEVDRVFTVPVDYFAAKEHAEVKQVVVNGYTRDVYFYTYDGETIWGATAFIIRDLLARIGALE